MGQAGRAAGPPWGCLPVWGGALLAESQGLTHLMLAPGLGESFEPYLQGPDFP